MKLLHDLISHATDSLSAANFLSKRSQFFVHSNCIRRNPVVLVFFTPFYGYLLNRSRNDMAEMQSKR